MQSVTKFFFIQKIDTWVYTDYDNSTTTKGYNMKKPQKQLTIQFSPELERAIREFAAESGGITFTDAVRFLVSIGLKSLEKKSPLD